MTYDDEAHDDLACLIYDAVRALPLTAGLRGVHEMSWTAVCTHMPIDAERYRMAADVAFKHLGRRLPPLRAKALREARKPRGRGRQRATSNPPDVRPDD